MFLHSTISNTAQTLAKSLCAVLLIKSSAPQPFALLIRLMTVKAFTAILFQKGGNLMQSPTEKLVQLAQTGDKQAFIELMEAHKHALTRAAMAILHNDEDVADAVAETVLKAFSKLHSLRQPKYFKTWLTRILICSSYDILRQRRRTVPLDQLPEPVGGEPDDQVLDIRESLSALAENDQLVLTLFYMDGFKVKEIAQIMGVKEGTVKSRLARSRRRLQEIYLEREGNPCEAK